MTTTTSHSAVDAALGYYFQGLYALSLLLDAGDAESVSIETEDDVVLLGAGSQKTLHQLKHSMGTPAALTETNDGLWKTLGFWIDSIDDPDVIFVFATCAKTAANSVLSQLSSPNTDRKPVVDVLTAEANRVQSERARQQAAGERLSFADRAAQCSKFLGLTDQKRLNLVERIRLRPDIDNASELTASIPSKLPLVPRPQRTAICTRLIEWWDRQVAQAFLRQRTREFTKGELQEKVSDLIISHGPSSLPDDYGDLSVPASAQARDSLLARQIYLVDGGDARVDRATAAQWRARNQRHRWITDNPGFAPVLIEYDDRLTECWRDLFEPMKHDSASLDDFGKVTKGRDLLDWAHKDAVDQVPRIRPGWEKRYLVQGSLQDLADRGRVGWHPDYQQLLSLVVRS